MCKFCERKYNATKRIFEEKQIDGLDLLGTEAYLKSIEEENKLIHKWAYIKGLSIDTSADFYRAQQDMQKDIDRKCSLIWEITLEVVNDLLLRQCAKEDIAHMVIVELGQKLKKELI